MTIEQILKEMSDCGYFIIDTWVDTLVTNGYGGIPVLVRRNLGRDVVRLRDLRRALAAPLSKDDYLRDCSTFSECLDLIKKGERNPNVPTKYFRC